MGPIVPEFFGELDSLYVFIGATFCHKCNHNIQIEFAPD